MNHPYAPPYNEKPGKSVGRPRIEWTPSQLRQMVRFKLNHDVEWDDLPQYLRDDEKKFAPSKSNCKAKWKEMTDMNAKDLQVKDPDMKKRRNQMALQAYHKYLKKHGYPDLDQAPVLPQLEPIPDIDMFEERCAALQDYDSPSSQSTANVLAVPSLSYTATTYRESRLETESPQTSGQSYVQQFSLNGDNTLASPPEHSMQLNPLHDQNQKKRSAPQRLYDRFKKKIRHEALSPSVDQDTRQMGGWAETPKISASISAGDALYQGVEDRIPPIVLFEAENSNTKNVKNKLSKEIAAHIRNLSGITAESAVSTSGSTRTRWSERSSIFKIGISRPQEDLSTVPIGREVVSLLHQQRGDGSTISYFEQRLQMLLGTGVNINARDDENGDKRPIHVALANGYTSVYKVLFENGADVNARDRSGNTPLLIAVAKGDLEACKLLKIYGADFRAKNNEGLGASGFGKRAKTQQNITPAQDLAIEACRNFVREHNPHRKSRKIISTYKLAPESDTRTVGPNSLSVARSDIEGAQLYPTNHRYAQNSLTENRVRHSSSFSSIRPSISQTSRRFSSISQEPENDTSRRTLDPSNSQHRVPATIEAMASQSPNHLRIPNMPHVPTYGGTSTRLTEARQPKSQNPSRDVFFDPSSLITLQPFSGGRDIKHRQNEGLEMIDQPFKSNSQSLNLGPTSSWLQAELGQNLRFPNLPSGLDMPQQNLTSRATNSSVSGPLDDVPTSRSLNSSVFQISGYIKQLSDGQYIVMSVPLQNQELIRQMHFTAFFPLTVTMQMPAQLLHDTIFRGAASGSTYRDQQRGRVEFQPGHAGPQASSSLAIPAVQGYGSTMATPQNTSHITYSPPSIEQLEELMGLPGPGPSQTRVQIEPQYEPNMSDLGRGNRLWDGMG